MHPPADETPPNRNFWRGPTIRLRAIEQADLDAILTDTEEPDTEIDRYEDAVPFPISREREREEVQKNAQEVGKEDYLHFAIENRAGQVVGYINNFDCQRRSGTFKYAILIKYAHWRKGYGREALTILLRYMFREMRYQKCTALVYSFNERSLRFHEAMGFTFEGRLRNMHYTNGEHYDEIYFGMTAAEWEQLDPVPALPRIRARAEG
jgi:RimJ/RimL family protein N-acetyltransferase